MEENTTIQFMPAVALRGITILPGTIIHFDLSRSKSIRAIEQAMLGDQQVFLVTQKDATVEDPGIEEVCTVGMTATIRQLTKLKNNILRVLVEGDKRADLLSFREDIEDYLCAEIEEQSEMEIDDPVEEDAMIQELREIFAAFLKVHPKMNQSVQLRIQQIKKIGFLIDELANSVSLSMENKQKLLEESDIRRRFALLGTILENEIQIAKIKGELSKKIKDRVDKNQREYLLREQMRFIREELGEDSNGLSDVEQFQEDLTKLRASKEVKEKIQKEINRFKNLSSSSSEGAVERGYIETLLDLPWDKSSKDSIDIRKAQKILDEDHYGLEKVKERVLEFLAVRTLTKHGESPILCLVGPPGTGKTSIAKSVAASLNKKYVRICLGGVRDEAEIRGHRRTYVGAMPGRIVSALKQAGVKNPMILLDEIDKTGKDQRGDTASALLEVLDGEQNIHFRDHYVEIPIDLSEVLFIATANTTETIPRPLLDRMEIIEVTSYTANEKFHIAKEHLLEKQLTKNGLTGKQLEISDNALKMMIQSYTREAGVRDLERKISQICRKAARRILETDKKDRKSAIKVTAQNLEKYLGKIKYTQTKKKENDEVGVVTGLAWTSVGGETLEIEVNIMSGKGDLELTGQMGDVMKESALAGISYIRSIADKYDISEEVFRDYDFHVHIPEGAVPKDGPSAGITMATAVLSAITEIPVKADLAMTGEITLRGRVLPIGGLKEKILAAKMSGITTILVPDENRKDIDEISSEIKKDLDIRFVKTMEEVLALALVPEKRPVKPKSSKKRNKK